MAEAFEPITTQEAFDAAVADRLAPYADYDDLKAQNADLNARIQTYETDALKTRIAHEVGLPFEMSSRLNGSTEADIRKDAQSLLKLLKPKNPPAPPRGDPQRRQQARRTAHLHQPADEQRLKEILSWQIF